MPPPQVSKFLPDFFLILLIGAYLAVTIFDIVKSLQAQAKQRRNRVRPTRHGHGQEGPVGGQDSDSEEDHTSDSWVEGGWMQEGGGEQQQQQQPKHKPHARKYKMKMTPLW